MQVSETIKIANCTVFDKKRLKKKKKKKKMSYIKIKYPQLSNMEEEVRRVETLSSSN